MNAIDLFAGGGGGWDLACRDLGIDVLGVELDDAACKTRDAAALRTIGTDVFTLNPHVVGWVAAPNDRVDGVIGSPPCPGFSKAGLKQGRIDESLVTAAVYGLGAGNDRRAELAPMCKAPRSMLCVEPLRYALDLRPTWIALEQVPWVLRLWECVADVLEIIGYHTWTGILHSEQFGVPQTRQRAILLAHKTEPVQAPAPTHQRYRRGEPATAVETLTGRLEPWGSMAQALGWPEDDKVGFARRADGRDNGAVYRERDLRRADEPAMAVTEKARSWQRRPEWAWDRPAPTISTTRGGVGGKRSDGHYNLTIQEAAVLQGFPADHPWKGNRTKVFEQIGNAIPPKLASVCLQAVATQVSSQAVL